MSENLQPTCNQVATDTISRQAAIKAICEDGTWLESQGCTEITMAERKQRDADILGELPSAEGGKKIMETMNRKEPGLCKINGVMYLDPSGDLCRIMLVIYILSSIVEDMFKGWTEATRIDDATIRHCAMETLRDSIDRMTYCIQKLDNLVDLTTKEVYHAEE